MTRMADFHVHFSDSVSEERLERILEDIKSFLDNYVDITEMTYLYPSDCTSKIEHDEGGQA